MGSALEWLNAPTATIVGVFIGAILTAVLSWHRETRTKSKQNAFDLALRWDSAEMLKARNNAWSVLVEPNINYWQDPYWKTTSPADPTQTRSDLLRILRFFKLVDSSKDDGIIDAGLAKKFFGDTYDQWVERYIAPQRSRWEELGGRVESHAEDHALFRAYEWLRNAPTSAGKASAPRTTSGTLEQDRSSSASS